MRSTPGKGRARAPCLAILTKSVGAAGGGAEGQQAAALTVLHHHAAHQGRRLRVGHGCGDGRAGGGREFVNGFGRPRLAGGACQHPHRGPSPRCYRDVRFGSILRAVDGPVGGTPPPRRPCSCVAGRRAKPVGEMRAAHSPAPVATSRMARQMSLVDTIPLELGGARAYGTSEIAGGSALVPLLPDVDGTRFDTKPRPKPQQRCAVASAEKPSVNEKALCNPGPWQLPWLCACVRGRRSEPNRLACARASGQLRRLSCGWRCSPWCSRD